MNLAPIVAPTLTTAVTRDLLIRIQMEYLEMPGLHLTPCQARRFWRLDAATCDAILGILVDEGFLGRTVAGAYIRLGTGRHHLPLAV